MVEQFWKGKTVEVIINPKAAGGRTLEQARSVVGILRRKGINAEEKFTEEPNHGIALGKSAAERKVDLVVAVGGDGILNEIINGVTSVGDTDTIVTSIPTGTVKIWGHETQTPLDNPELAVDALLGGEIYQVDLLHLAWEGQERKALLEIGFGYDGQVFDAVHKPGTVRRRGGVSTYVLEAVRQYPRLRTPKTTITIDGEREKVMDRFVQGWLINSTRITQLRRKPVILDPDAQLDSGKATFVGYDAGNSSKFSATRRLVVDALRSGKASRSDMFDEGIVFELHSEKPIKIQGDGDAWGESTDIFADVLPGALRVLVPQQQETTIFQYPGINVS